MTHTYISRRGCRLYSANILNDIAYRAWLCQPHTLEKKDLVAIGIKTSREMDLERGRESG